MHLREAQPSDRAPIRDVARQSLQTSYALSPGIIETAVEEWYAHEAFRTKLGREDVLFVVAVTDGTPVGFSESVVTPHGTADLQWLHVSPAYRGRGIGKRLFDRTRDMLDDHGVDHLLARVLAVNEEGNQFYVQQGFDQVDTNEVDIGGKSHREHVYVAADAPSLQSTQNGDGQELFVDLDDDFPGSRAPFHVVHSDPGRDTQYGFYCSNCESLANSMDSMGRVECVECGNVRQPQRWDAAYL